MVRANNITGELFPVQLSSEEEDVSDFTSVAFSDDFLLAAGGGVSPHGIYATRLADIQSTHGGEEGIRGTMQEFNLPLDKRYGINLIEAPRWATNETRLIFSSNNEWDHSVKTASLRSGNIEVDGVFSGHKDVVTGLAVPPPGAETGSNMFLSSSVDGTVCLWARDKTGKPIHRWNMPGRPVATFDGTGLVVSIAVGDSSVELYDRRALSTGTPGNNTSQPFAVMKTGLQFGDTVKKVEWFPGTSRKILISSDKSIAILDTNTQRAIPPRVLNESSDTYGAAALLPDQHHIFRATRSGDVHLFNHFNSTNSHFVPSSHSGISSHFSQVVFCPTNWAAATISNSILTCWLWPCNLYSRR